MIIGGQRMSMSVSGNVNRKGTPNPSLFTLRTERNDEISSEKTSGSFRIRNENTRKKLNPFKTFIGGVLGGIGGLGLGLKLTFNDGYVTGLARGVVRGIRYGNKPLETTKEEKINKYEDKINKNIEKFFEQKDNESYTQQFDRILRVDNIIKTKAGKKIEFTPFDKELIRDNLNQVCGSRYLGNEGRYSSFKSEVETGLIKAKTKDEARKMLDKGPEIFNLTGTVDEVLQEKLYDIVNSDKSDQDAMEDLKDTINTYHGKMINEMKNMVYGEENNKDMTDFWKKNEEVVQGTATIDLNEVEKDLNVQRDKTNPAFVKLVRLNVIKELRAEFNKEREKIFNKHKEIIPLYRDYHDQEARWENDWYDKWNKALDSGKKNANDEIMDSLKCDKNSYSEIMDSLKCDKNSARNENNYKYFRCELSMLTRLIEEEDKLIKQDDQVGINEKIFSDIAKEYRVQKGYAHKKDGITSEESEKSIDHEINRLKKAITNDKNITETENNNSREKIKDLLVNIQSEKKH